MTLHLLRLYLRRSKDLALRISFVEKANSRIKARELRRKLQELAGRYEYRAREEGIEYAEDMAWAEARKRISSLRAGRPSSGNAPSVFWVGANRDQDESGFLQALRKLAHVRVFTNHMGEYGQWYRDESGNVRVYDTEIVRKNDEILLRQIRSARADGGADLLMGQMWANYISKEALAEIRSMGIPVINISMDDRLPDNWSARKGVRLGAVGLSSSTDLVLTTSNETCLWYLLEGCPAVFWPLASDPSVFSPQEEGHRDIDVLFIGNKYGIRGKIIAEIARYGIHVECYGSGWPNGPATAEQSAQLFKRARIILGIGTVGYCEDVFTLKLRDFDAPMSGALYLTHRAPDLTRLFKEGVEIECYQTPQEAAEKIRFYLENHEKLNQVAGAGLKKALNFHTWTHRLETTLSTLHVLGVNSTSPARPE